MHIEILQGPNLHNIGLREPEIYGSHLWSEYYNALQEYYKQQSGLSLGCKQSHHEGQLIDWLYQAEREAIGVVLNPGGLAHSSVSLRDAISNISIPVIEVHLSNIFSRESFRQRLVTAGAAAGVISGLGLEGYQLAIEALLKKADKETI